jgi:spore maturation protein CgeB
MRIKEQMGLSKLLYFQWKSFMNPGIERALQRKGLPYDTFFYQFTDWEKDDAFCERLEQKLKGGAYDRVFSVNYSPLISTVCKKLQIAYISWIYDCPIHIRDLTTLTNDCNTIYFFDRIQAKEHKKQGVNARHLPLAVDAEVFREVYEKTPDAQFLAKCQTDVTLVGKLYQTEYQYYSQPLTEYQRGYLEGILAAQLKVYGGYLIPELITEELLADLNKSYAKASGNRVNIDRRELEYMLSCETTGRERYIILGLLSQHFRTALWSNEKDERLAQVAYNGYADYYTQMPYIFHHSKMNLNIALRAIQTGIPLRVLDIMGCGGFVLTNYREEIAEHFVNGEECIIYENLEDMYAKAKFYLEHETERRKIAENGLKKVQRDFTFDQALSVML